MRASPTEPNRTLDRDARLILINVPLPAQRLTFTGFLFSSIG
jgi:hypothetical protein